jgi:hypothetical protein
MQRVIAQLLAERGEVSGQVDFAVALQRRVIGWNQSRIKRHVN